jgi:acetyl esterase/lipase
MAPEHPYPAAVEDALRAYGWILDHCTHPQQVTLAGDPPAAADPLPQNAHHLTDHARRCGVDTRLELYPADTHIFQLFWPFLPEAADAIHQAGSFIRNTHASRYRNQPAAGQQDAKGLSH